MTTSPVERLYADDPDAHRTWPIYDHDLTDPIEYDVTVKLDGTGAVAGTTATKVATWTGTTTTTTYQGRAATSRLLRVPLDGLAAGTYTARALVVGGNDINLGSVTLD